MNSMFRAVLGLVVALALLGPAPIADARTEPASSTVRSPSAPSALPSGLPAAPSSELGGADVDDLDPRGLDDGDDGGSALAPIVGFAALVAVLLLGLRAIRNQRRSGTRRRFPPIG